MTANIVVCADWATWNCDDWLLVCTHCSLWTGHWARRTCHWYNYSGKPQHFWMISPTYDEDADSVQNVEHGLHMHIVGQLRRLHYIQLLWVLCIMYRQTSCEMWNTGRSCWIIWLSYL